MNITKELAVLEKAIDIADKKKNRQMATNVRVVNMLAIVRRFVERKGRLLQGGMAINFILPEEDRFYNPEYDVPDQDFMTPSGALDAIELADEFHKLGYPNVEVKPALHVGTLKVYVDFVAVADITTVSRRFYNYLVNDSVNVDGLRFVGPNYLRMSMYLELSRPMGDVSRWGKVFKRLRLLDDAHPYSITECTAKTHNLDNRKTPNMELQEAIAKFGKDRQVVFMGDMALNILRNISKRGNPLRIPDRGTQQIFLSEDAKGDTNLLIGALNGMGINPRMVEHAAYGELVPVHQEVRITLAPKNTFSIFLYQAQFGCHSYQKLKQGDGEELRVASVQTILSFYLAFVMTNRKYHDKKKLMCISRELIDLADKLFKSGRPPFLGFPVFCVGHQPQREDMMRERNETSAVLKMAGNQADYLKVFLSYNPAKPGDARKKEIIRSGTKASPLKSQRQASVRKSLKKNSALKQVPSKAVSASRKTSKRLRSARRSHPFK